MESLSSKLDRLFCPKCRELGNYVILTLYGFVMKSGGCHMSFMEQFTNLMPVNVIVNILDVLFVWFVIYKLITLIKGTKAVQLLKGIFVIIIARVVTDFLGMDTLGWLLENVISIGFFAIIVIFQPEIRRALEQIGRGKLFARSSSMQEEEEKNRLIEAMTKSVSYMAKRRIGALISIERETGLT